MSVNDPLASDFRIVPPPPNEPPPSVEAAPGVARVLSDEQVARMVQPGSLGGEDPGAPAGAGPQGVAGAVGVLGPVEYETGDRWIADPEPPSPAPAKRSRRAKKPKRPKRTQDAYLFLVAAELENGDPFWYVAHENTGFNRQHAIRKLWIELGRPAEGISFYVQKKDAWTPLSLSVEEVVRTPTLKTVVK